MRAEVIAVVSETPFGQIIHGRSTIARHLGVDFFQTQSPGLSADLKGQLRAPGPGFLWIRVLGPMSIALGGCVSGPARAGLGHGRLT